MQQNASQLVQFLGCIWFRRTTGEKVAAKFAGVCYSNRNRLTLSFGSLLALPKRTCKTVI